MAKHASLSEGTDRAVGAQARRVQGLLRDLDAELADCTRGREEAQRRLAAAERALGPVIDAQSTWQPTRGDGFEMEMDGTSTTNRGDAARLLAAGAREPSSCRLGGVPIELRVRPVAGGPSRLVMALRDVPEMEVDARLDELEALAVGTGMIRRLENRLARLPELEGRIRREGAAAAAAAARAGEEIERLGAERADLLASGAATADGPAAGAAGPGRHPRELVAASFPTAGRPAPRPELAPAERERRERTFGIDARPAEATVAPPDDAQATAAAAFPARPLRAAR